MEACKFCSKQLIVPMVQIFANSVWAKRPTPGSVLLNLRFRDESRASQHAPASQPEQVHQRLLSNTPFLPGPSTEA